jgi:ATP-dependent Clp protease ATP-binding subunit ClpA
MEMSALTTLRVGFHAPTFEDAGVAAKLSARISQAELAAARRKFSPEFLNRLDKIVVFRSLGNTELRNRRYRTR